MAKRYIRLERLKNLNYPNKAYQVEQITVENGVVVSTRQLGKPNTLVMVLAQCSEHLDPEAIV